MSNTQDFDFGYSWIWTYGHLLPTALFAVSAGIALPAGAPAWVWVPLSALAMWALTGFLVSRFVFRMNAPLHLPSTSFLAGGGGTVLDLGCGSGRTSIMVGLERPKTEIIGLDDFSAHYIEGHGKAKTLRNFEAAGIYQRATIQEGDLRSLPFDNLTFDAAVSSYAIDHLEPQDIPVALAETYRALRNGGEFLLMVIVPNFWTVLTFSPVIFLHFRSRRYWRRVLEMAGFRAESEGSSRGLAWFLLRKDAAAAPANEALVGKYHSERFGKSSISSVERKARRGHAFSIRSMIAPVGLTALGIFLAALTLRLLNVDISWWWIAAAIPIGMHAGVILLMLVGLLRLLSGRKARKVGSPL
jgi:SAM-dependent methyltransferase